MSQRVPQLVGQASCNMVNAGSNRSLDRVVLLVDDTRFVVDVDSLRAHPNTMLGRFVDYLETFLDFHFCELAK